MGRLFSAGVVGALVMLLSAASLSAGPSANYYYFKTDNGGKVYCRIDNNEKKTVKIVSTLTCRYKDDRTLQVNFSRPVVQQVEGSLTLPASVDLRHCDELYNIDEKAGVYTLVGIDGHAFKDCNKLQAVSIPSSVKTIGEYAFTGCTSLRSITLPGTLENLSLAFAAGCDNLEAVNVGSGVGLTYHSFDGVLCKEGEIVYCPPKCPRSLTIPDSIKGIAKEVFAKNKQLNSVTISGATKIGEGAFKDCPNLQSVSILGPVEEIGDKAFEKCTALESILIPGSVKSVGGQAFSGCTALSSIAFGEGVETIGHHAFSECSMLTNVSMPKSLRKMYYSVFENCFGLERVVLQEGLESIPESAFCFCTALREIRVPSTVWVIRTKAFMGCTALERVVLPSAGLQEIGRYVFFGCENLTSINVPENTVTYEDTFFGCDKLVR